MRVIPVSCSEGLSNSKGRHTNNDSNMAPGDVWYNCTLPPTAECDMIDDLAGVFQLCALLHFAGTDFKDTRHQHGVYLLPCVWAVCTLCCCQQRSVFDLHYFSMLPRGSAVWTRMTHRKVHG